MNVKSYLEERSNLADCILHNTHTEADDMLNRTFNFVSANLLHFMPDLPVQAHDRIFKNILLHQKLSLLDHRYPEIIADAQLEGCYEAALMLLKKQPVIICTFHMGSNRLLNHFLAQHQVPYSLVLANHIGREEGSDFCDMFDSRYKSGNEKGMDIIYAQKADAGLKMLRALKNGRSLLVYIDGNTGAGDDSIRNKNRCKIDFLGQSIYARNGVCYISHLANVPVVPAVCYRKEIDDLRLRFSAPVYPERTQDRKAYASATTRQMYSLLAPLVREYPEQWECWMYLHTIADHSNFTISDSAPNPSQPATSTFQLNKSRFGFFNIGEELYLFDKRTYNSYPVNEEIYRVLQKAATLPVQSDELNQQVFNQLYEHAVFVSA